MAELELSLWRARIGRFRGKCRHLKVKLDLKLCYRLVLKQIGLKSQYGFDYIPCTCNLDRINSNVLWTNSLRRDLSSASFNVMPTLWTNYWYGFDLTALVLFGGRCTVIALLAVNIVFHIWRLILSHDVEKNPGPPKKTSAGSGSSKKSEGSSKKTDTNKQEELERRINVLENGLEEKLTRIMSAVESQAKSMTKIENTQRETSRAIGVMNKKLSDLGKVEEKSKEG